MRMRLRWAHPHSRGENAIAAAAGVIGTGSSPLTRGKPKYRTPGGMGQGLIPTHAGKTPPPPGGRGRVWAHPHSRGENETADAFVVVGVGSSPLTRGKPVKLDTGASRRGLIPTHAGKTPYRGQEGTQWGAHPHSRGENNTTEYATACQLGSSPLTRGKRFLTCAFIAQIGQILESLELCASSESYSLLDAYATDAPQDRVRSIGLVPRSSRGAS